MASRVKELILPLHSTVVRPHLEHHVQLWGPQHRKDMDVLEQVQSTTTKIIREMELPSYEERLRKLELFYLERK